MSDNEMRAEQRTEFYAWYHRVYGVGSRGFGLCEGDMYEAWKAATRPALTDEQVRAEMESAQYEFVESYFKARPSLWKTIAEIRLVEAGFQAGWEQRAEKAGGGE